MYRIGAAYRYFFAWSLLALASNNLNIANAFRITTTRPSVGRQIDTKLMAWSIPTPNMSPLTSLTSGWYQECHPTARKTVYNDFITDYTYVDTPYDDFWAPTEDRIVSLLESSSALDGASELAPQKSRRNPLRRAARWARRQFVRGNDDSNQI